MSELQQAINEMRNMRESYDQIGAAAEAYNVGKMELAAAITGKGVETSPTESYPEMAKKVNAISQESYTIQGGEIYGNQLFGGPDAPKFWNLYEVLMQLLSDGRFVQYGGILLASYYKGYDNIALEGAGAGGGYVTSDGHYYTGDDTHVWDDTEDGYLDRWVAYLFAGSGHGFTITNTNLCPRKIYIGRHVGVVESVVNGRISDIVVPNENILEQFKTNTYNQNWSPNIVLRNIQSASSQMVVLDKDIASAYIDIGEFVADSQSAIIQCSPQRNIYELCIRTRRARFMSINYVNSDIIVLDCESIDSPYNQNSVLGVHTYTKDLYLLNCEEVVGTFMAGAYKGVTRKVYLSYKTNDKSRSVWLLGTWQNTDFELKNGWCKPLNVKDMTSLTKENVQAHIFDRLGVNDLSTGAVTITLATAVLNLFTQEEIDAVVARTNITIVGA